jgi:hypothetical protein
MPGESTECFDRFATARQSSLEDVLPLLIRAFAETQGVTDSTYCLEDPRKLSMYAGTRSLLSVGKAHGRTCASAGWSRCFAAHHAGVQAREAALRDYMQGAARTALAGVVLRSERVRQRVADPAVYASGTTCHAPAYTKRRAGVAAALGRRHNLALGSAVCSASRSSLRSHARENVWRAPLVLWLRARRGVSAWVEVHDHHAR